MKKLIASLFMMVMLIVSLTTTTYAFIVISNDASIREYDFNVEAQKGIQLSLDGIVYYNDIPSDLIKKKISADYDNLKFTGVTPKIDSGNFEFVDNRAQFVKDIVVDGKHEYDLAVANKDYIRFDLWVKMLNTDLNDKTEYRLKINENTDITSTTNSINLDNNLMTQNGLYGPLTEDRKSIDVNMQDAMRMAIDVEDDNDSISIYELHDNLGSHAIEGSTDPKHDKTKNAMYTYYNNILCTTPFTVAGEAYLTNSKSDLASKVFATFSNTTVKETKLTFYIWLEGWDADFLIGMPTSARTAKINIELELI